MKRWLLIGLVLMATFYKFYGMNENDAQMLEGRIAQALAIFNFHHGKKTMATETFGSSGSVTQITKIGGNVIVETRNLNRAKPVRHGGGMLYYGAKDNKIWVVDPDSFTVKGPFQADTGNLFSVVGGTDQVVFATGGFEASYITAFDLQGKKLHSANLNFLASGYNENGFNSMLIDAKQKYIYGTTDTFYDANWNGGYPGIVRLDAKTLQPLDVISMEGTVTGNFMYSAARLGNIGYFCSAAGVVMMQLDPFAYLGTFVWNTGGYYFNPPLIPGSPPPPLVYGDESPGLVVADEARNCLYVGMSNTVTKRLLKLSPSLGVLANLPLSDTPESSAMSSGVVIGKYLFYGAVPNGPPDKLIKVDLETFSVVGELQLSGWTAAITTDGKNVFAGVNENTFRTVDNHKYSLVKVNPATMQVMDTVTLVSGTEAAIESGVFIEN